jgi:hypothetical protein
MRRPYGRNSGGSSSVSCLPILKAVVMVADGWILRECDTHASLSQVIDRSIVPIIVDFNLVV